MEISPTDLFASPGGEYTVSISLPDKGEVNNPTLNVTLSGANVEISGATTIRSNGFAEDDKTASDPTFVEYSSDKVLSADTIFVTLQVSNTASVGANMSLVANYTGDTGLIGGEFDITESANYEVNEHSYTMASMARQAEQRAQMADTYAEAYDGLEKQQEIFTLALQRGLISGFVSVGIELAKSFADGPLGLVFDTQEAYDTIVREGGTTGEAFDILDSIAQQLDEFPETVYSQDDTGESLRQLADNHQAEADAWRNGDRESLLTILPDENEAICHPNGDSSNDTSLRQNNRAQYPCVWGAAENELDYIRNAPSLEPYYEAVQTFALQDLLHIRSQVRPLAKRPSPSVDTNRSHSDIGSDFASLNIGEQTTVEIDVSNAGSSGISDRGYLTISHATSLNIVSVNKTAGDTDEDFDRTDLEPGEEINTRNGTATAEYPLTDLVESYNQGETNTYAVTLERTDSGSAWFTYRAAHKPALVEESADPNFARAPTSGDRDQQDWYAYRVEENSPAAFDVSIGDVNDPVVEGETLTIPARITNTGGIAGTGSLEFFVDGNQACSYQESLDPDQSATRSCDYATSVGDEPSVGITVETSDNSDSYTASVDPAPDDAYFDISIDDVNDPVVEGETLQAEVSVTNTGDKTGTQTIRFEADGAQVNSESITVDGDGIKSRTLSYATESGDSPSVSLVISSDGNGSSDSYDASVSESETGEFFSVEISTNEPVTVGNSLEVDITVSNTGDAAGTQTVYVEGWGGTKDGNTYSLGPDESDTGSWRWGTSDVKPRTYTAEVWSKDDSASTPIEVIDSNDISVTATDKSTTVGGSANISITGNQISQLTISNLWADWRVNASMDNGKFQNHVTEKGECVLEWSSVQSSASVPLTISLPDQYVGGTYVLNFIASNSDATAETQASLTISMNKTETNISFENASIGANEPADPWLVKDPYPEYNSVEISDQHATHGSQTLHMSANGSLENLLVGVTANFSDVTTILCDAYLERANNSFGYINIGSWDGNNVNKAIGVLGQTDGTGKFTNLEGDVSHWTGEHDFVFNVQGDNEAYFDNLRFLDTNGNLIPPAELNLSPIG